MGDQWVSSHSQGSAAKHRDEGRPPGWMEIGDRQRERESFTAGVHNCRTKLKGSVIIDKQQK